MKTTLFARAIRPLAFGLCLCGAITVLAQNFNFFRERERNERTRTGAVPTVITSDNLDIDIANDLATFTGHVVVEDEEMRISCNKMLIHLAEEKPAGEKPAPVAMRSSSAGNKRVTRIVCLGEVIIIRKLTAADQQKGEQKALAGKADYDVDSGMIVLTEDPVLIRVPDSLRGKRITIWRDSDKMQVEGGSHLELKSDAMHDPNRNPSTGATP